MSESLSALFRPSDVPPPEADTEPGHVEEHTTTTYEVQHYLRKGWVSWLGDMDEARARDLLARNRVKHPTHTLRLVARRTDVTLEVIE